MRNQRGKARVLIAVPLAGPFIYWRTVAAILEMEKPAQSDLLVFQGALIDRARNRIVEQMLEHPIVPTHLLFLDADIVPPADALTRLLKADAPIVSGLYRKRVPPFEPMAFQLRAKKLVPISARRNGILSVDCVGAGCLLVKREVFEKIDPPWFTSEWTEKGQLSEDFSFCKKARQSGYKILIDTRVAPLHLEPMGVGSDAAGAVRFIPMS